MNHGGLTRWVVYALTAVAVLGVVITAGRRLGSESEKPGELGSVALRSVADSGAVTAFPTSLIARVHSPHGIVKVVLTVDGDEVDAWEPWRSLEDAVANLQWTPQADGVHELQAVLHTGDGETLVSNQLLLSAGPPPAPLVLVESVVGEPTTIGEIAAASGANAERLSALNGGLSSEEPIPAGSRINLPVAAVPETAGPAQPNGREGEPRLEGGRLYVPGGADVAYIYVEAAAGTWIRIPPESTELVPVEPDGGHDLTPWLVGFAGPATVEVWGWVGDSLSILGTVVFERDATVSAELVPGFERFVPTTQLDMVQLVQSGGEFQFEETLTRFEHIQRRRSVDVAEGDTTVPPEDYVTLQPESLDVVRTFRWSTADPDVLGARWVVGSTLQPTDAPLESGNHLASELVPDDAASGGDFTINVTELIAAEDERGLRPWFWPLTTEESETAEPAPLTWLGVQLVPVVERWYVQVVPVLRDGSFGSPSNAVVLDLLPPPAPPWDWPYEARIASFTAPYLPDFAFSDCVLVTAVDSSDSDTGGSVPSPVNLSFYEEGQALCRPEPQNEDKSLLDRVGDFFSGIGDAWDFIADGLSWLKSRLVELGAKLNPLCHAYGELADEVGAPENGCEMAIEIGVDAYLAANGIPPTLPTSDDLLAAAEGDLKQLTFETLKELGVPCDELEYRNPDDLSDETNLCRQMIDEIWDLSAEELDNVLSQSAAQAAGVWVPPGVSVIPHPRGQAGPAILEVELTRVRPTDIPQGCLLRANIFSQREAAIWRSPITMNDRIEDIEGFSFIGSSRRVPDVPVGETVAVTFVLADLAPWFPDGDEAVENGTVRFSAKSMAYLLLQPNAIHGASVSGDCVDHAGASAPARPAGGE